ncbi:major facilitator superfamily-domain-containing protein [Aspergillus parasiticus]|uniref:Efflux pump dotC n=1 Tax=Aspergillus parasiticus TaxID=5067 RepID=A0A5N6DW86_ASPPA|nr:major facilitator superfamily-domain-containing protein [Aspergillus parasiticus]
MVIAKETAQPFTMASSQPPATTDASSRSLLQISIVMSCLCAGTFVAALDATIVTTSLPSIAGHFHSASGYTWIGSAYILANTASVPSWGKLSDIWGRKPLLLCGNAIFFAGSLICSIANTMALFLFGRVMQGLGAAALMTLVNICVCDLFSLRDRGLYFGLLSVDWALASGIGPILGGVLTEKATWRWCFWINLPITGLAFLLLWLALKLDNPHTPIWDGLKAVDWVGSLFVIGSSIMLLLALDFGGVTHPWNSATVICLIVFSIAVLSLFVLNEWKLAKYPVIPLILFQHRSGIAAFVVCFCHGFIFMGEAYYLPLYFQAVLGATPIKSGVYLLAFVIACTFSGAFTGLFIQKTGQYIPPMWLGLGLLTLGVGLLINLEATANWGKIIGFQVISGLGIGMNFEGPLLALQAIVGAKNTATATATIGFVRTMSTAISVVIGGVVFQNQMVKEGPNLVQSLGSELAGQFGGANVTANIQLIGTLPADQREVVRQAVFGSLRTTWIMYVAFAGASLVAGFFVGAHHLSEEHEVAVLGLHGPSGDSSEDTSNDAPATRTMEMQ